MTRTYFAYIRVSTVKQGEQGSSLQEQRSAIEAYAVRHGLTICRWFEERETAAKLGRQLFNSMISQLKRNTASGVIIHKIDRSARNLKDWAALGELIDKGVDVHFAHESLDLASRGGRLAADIQAVVAADYIRNLRDEVRKGFYGRLKQGLFPLPAPIGYLDCGRGKPKEIDPVAGPLVRDAFQLYLSGKFSVDALRDEMARRGLRNRLGKPLSKNGINRLLHNPFYMGLVRIESSGQTFAGVHQPLITTTMFEGAAAIMAGRSYVGATKHDFPYSRLIICQGCNRSVIGERQKGHTYYRCHTKACRGTSMRERDIESDMCAVLSLLALDAEDLRELGDLRDDAATADKAEIAKALSLAKLQLGNCKDRLAKLTDAYIDQAIDRETFEERKGLLLKERRGYEEAIEQPSKQGPVLSLIEKLELGNMALSKAESPISDRKRDAVKSTMSNLYIHGKELVFEPRFPFDKVIEERISHYGAPYRVQPRKGYRVPTSVARDSPVHIVNTKPLLVQSFSVILDGSQLCARPISIRAFICKLTK